MEECTRCKDNPHYTPGYHEEIPDPTPVEVPVGFAAPESLEDMMRRLIVQQQTALARGATPDIETEEEANDFDTGEEEPVIGHHQVIAMLDELPTESKLVDPPAPPEKPAAPPADKPAEPPAEK